jgi:hypothetical protein
VVFAQSNVAFQNEDLLASRMIVRGISGAGFEFQQNRWCPASFFIKPQRLYEHARYARFG